MVWLSNLRDFYNLFGFVSSETKRIYFDFGVNYLHSGVEWPIKTEFVIENLNIYEMRKQTREHVNLKNDKSRKS